MKESIDPAKIGAPGSSRPRPKFWELPGPRPRSRPRPKYHPPAPAKFANFAGAGAGGEIYYFILDLSPEIEVLNIFFQNFSRASPEIFQRYRFNTQYSPNPNSLISMFNSSEYPLESPFVLFLHKIGPLLLKVRGI